MNRKPITKTVTILNGSAESEAFRFDGYTHLGLEMPAALDGTVVFFKAASSPTGTFREVNDSAGNRVEIGVAQVNEAVGLTEAEEEPVRPWAYLKVCTDVNQTADRAFGAALK